MDISTLLVLLLGLLIGAVAGVGFGALWASARAAGGDGRGGLGELADEQVAVRESLDRLFDHMSDLNRTSASWQGQFQQQVHDVVHHTDQLRRETQHLVTALRRPQVRGQWGELHLRRAVELAGMVAHCDFSEQVRFDDGAQRPDLVVHLAGGRSVVVDAKVALDAFLDASAADDAEEAARHLERHAAQVRTHVGLLSSKAYWRSLTETPEFVVLFLPAEPFLGAALEVDAELLEYAAQRQVVLATPSTLIALLRTVEHGWRHEALTEQAAEIAGLGRELHTRLDRFRGHLDKVGQSLNTAVDTYNRAVGSLDRRVLVTSRRLAEAGIADDAVQAPRQVELRAVQAARHAEDESGAEDPPNRSVAL